MTTDAQRTVYNKAYIDALEASLPATYGMYVSVMAHGAEGDGTTDDTAAIEAAIAACPVGGVVFLPPGDYLISSPIDLNGRSLLGASQFATTILADPGTSDWRVDPVSGAVNDVAMVFALNKSNWFIDGIGIDGQDAYTSGLVAEGGSYIRFARNYVRGTGAQCGLQFMGARASGQEAISHSAMVNNISEGNLWNYVLDGEQHDVMVSNNIGIDAVGRHLSIDPNEASNGNHIAEGIVIVGNVFVGHGTAPAGWSEYPTTLTKDYAIRVGTAGDVGHVTMTGNSIRNWNGTHGISLTAGGIVSGNIIENDATEGRGTGSGIQVLSAAPGLLVEGNTVRNYDRGFTADNSQRIEVSRNRFEDVTSRYLINGVTYESGSTITPGSGSRFVDNTFDDMTSGIFDVRAKHLSAFVAPGQMQPNQNAPSQSWTGGRTSCWLMDASNVEAVGFSWVVPDDWSAAEVELYWSAPSGTGDVVWQLQTGAMSEGNPLPDGGNSESDVTATAGTANRLIITDMPASGLASLTPGQVVIFEVRRQASSGSDTLAVDAALIGVKINRA